MFGRIFRHGELTSMSQPSPTLRIVSPGFVIKAPSSEYTLPRPARSPTCTTSSMAAAELISWHQEQCWNRRGPRVSISFNFRQKNQQIKQSVFGNVRLKFRPGKKNGKEKKPCFTS